MFAVVGLMEGFEGSELQGEGGVGGAEGVEFGLFFFFVLGKGMLAIIAKNGDVVVEVRRKVCRRLRYNLPVLFLPTRSHKS